MTSTFWTKILSRWSVTAAGTTGGATATHTITSRDSEGYSFKAGVRRITFAGDLAGSVCTIESPAGTVLWQHTIGASELANDRVVDFDDGEMMGADNQNILAKIATSTAHCTITLDGYEVRGAKNFVNPFPGV